MAKPVLTKDDYDTLDEAHARICTEWENVRIEMRPPVEMKLARSIRIINSNLDVINDLIRYRRRCTQTPPGAVRLHPEIHAYEDRTQSEIAQAQAESAGCVDVDALFESLATVDPND